MEQEDLEEEEMKQGLIDWGIWKLEEKLNG